jgi:hypothetical protein
MRHVSMSGSRLAHCRSAAALSRHVSIEIVLIKWEHGAKLGIPVTFLRPELVGQASPAYQPSDRAS